MSKNRPQAIVGFEDIEIYPVDASKQGGNACYVDTCQVVGSRPAYAACLSRIQLRADGKSLPSQPECATAINRGECPAQAMRKEEIDAGQAIYFINRRKLREFIDLREGNTAREVIAEAVNWVKAKVKPKAPPPAAPKHFLDSDVGDYAAALNTAINKPSAPPAEAKSGMSLLELARASLAAKSKPVHNGVSHE
jgi:hypothetical protein